MFSFYSVSIMFHVAISKTSSKKRRVKILNISEILSFSRDTKMSKTNAKMKNAKKNINFCNMKILNQLEINSFR